MSRQTVEERLATLEANQHNMADDVGALKADAKAVLATLSQAGSARPRALRPALNHHCSRCR